MQPARATGVRLETTAARGFLLVRIMRVPLEITVAMPKMPARTTRTQSGITNAIIMGIAIPEKLQIYKDLG